MLVEPGQPTESLPSADFLFGSTCAMREVRVKLEQASEEGFPLLIEGEHGTGKELVARFLHKLSSRARGPFVRVNCGAMPVRLLEREILPGNQGGQRRLGDVQATLMALATGGTLFLDEIADMDLGLQEKLAQILNGSRSWLADIRQSAARARILCASKLAMEEAVERGRISAVLAGSFGNRVRLLPLRERKQDIPRLCEFLAARFARSFSRPVPRLESFVLEAFEQWSWPGNIRELENWIARIVIFGQEEVIGREFMRQFKIGPVMRHHRAVLENPRRQRRSRRRQKWSQRGLSGDH